MPTEGDYTYTVTSNKSTITAYGGAGGSVTIPSTLGGYPTVAIVNNVFSNNTNLVSVVIPDSIKTIGYSAFLYCTELISVDLGEGATSIDSNAFYGCSSLISVIIPDSVTYLGEDVFSGCSMVTTAVLGSGMTTTGNGIFRGCSSLEHVTIPSSIIEIGSYAFLYCSSLSEFTLPSNIISIGEMAFRGCGFTTIHISDNVEFIGGYVFCSSNDLISISVDPANPNYSSDNGVLYDKNKVVLMQYPLGKSGSFTIPDTVTTINELAIAESEAVTEIIVGEGIVELPAWVFDFCVNLENVVLGENITILGEGAFEGCAIASLTIPPGVTAIGNYLFYDCIYLADVNFAGLSSPTVDGTDWLVNVPSTVRGHALHGSNFPDPGYDFNGLMMGDHYIPIPSVPGIPTNFTVSSGDTEASLEWENPDTATSYNIYRADTETGTYIEIDNTSSLTYTDDGLINEQMYWYEVTGVNDVGEGDPTEPISVVPAIITVPSVPRNIVVTAGDEQVSITWEAPISSGGSAVDYYILYQDDIDVFHVSGLLKTVIGLTNGQSYVFNISAHNAIGEGVISGNYSATPYTVPDAIDDLSATIGNAQVTLNWTAPFDGGGDIDYYIISQDDTPFSWTVVTTASTIIGLTNGTEYSFKVKAHNSAGLSDYSNEVLITPVTIPSTPLDFSIEPGVRELILTWTAPDDGGSVILYYNIYRFGEIYDTTTELTYTDTPLADNTEFTYYISAVNAIDEGPTTSQVSESTLLSPTGLEIYCHTVPTAGENPYTYTWNTNPVLTTATVSYSFNDLYELDITSQATSTESKHTIGRIHFNNLEPTLDADYAVSVKAEIDDEQFPVTITYTPTITGGTAPYTYEWQFEEDGKIFEDETPSFTYASMADIMVFFTITDSLGTSVTMDVEFEVPATTVVASPLVVELNAVAVLDIGANTILGQCTSFVTGGTSPYSYEWDFYDGQPATITRNASHTFTAGFLTMDASLKVSDADEYKLFGGLTMCEQGITPIPLPDVDADLKVWVNLEVDLGSILELTLTSTVEGGIAPYTYEWYKGSDIVPDTTEDTTATFVVNDIEDINKIRIRFIVVDTEGHAFSTSIALATPDE